jgi:hypothetical protein
MDFFISYKNVLLIYLLISFGLVVLIWLVQLIIYPNFQYLSRDELHKWHRVYTPRITFVVAPLMILQLLIGVYVLFLQINLLTVSSTLLIVLNWLITFIYFVPLHVKLDQDSKNQQLLKKLISFNWYRTIIWSCVFFIVLAEQLT